MAASYGKKSDIRTKKPLTEGEKGATILKKTKKVGCIRLTSSKGKEVNSEKTSSNRGAVWLRGCMVHSRFLFLEWRCFGH